MASVVAQKRGLTEIEGETPEKCRFSIIFHFPNEIMPRVTSHVEYCDNSECKCKLNHVFHRKYNKTFGERDYQNQTAIFDPPHVNELDSSPLEGAQK